MKTYKNEINKILQNPKYKHGLTCAELSKKIAKKFNREYYKEKDLNSTISSILRKMVDNSYLHYNHSKKGPRGGKVYQYFYLIKS